MVSLTLGYWDIRGLAEPIRFLLHYKKVKFNDKRYDFKSDEWQKDKSNLGLDFPSLPYLIDGDVKITQSYCILRYLAEKYQMDGTTSEEKLQVSMLEQHVYELTWNVFLVLIAPDLEKAKEDFVKSSPEELKMMETFLGDKRFLVGNSVTYVDFLFFEAYDFYRHFIPEVCKDFPILEAFQKRIFGLPELRDYFNSPAYTRWPIFTPIAMFGEERDFKVLDMLNVQIE